MSTLKKFLVVVIAIMFLPACNIASGSGNETGGLMEFTVLAAQSSSANALSKQLAVIESGSQLQELWRELKVSEPLPAVDFSSGLVLAVIAGPRPTPCHDVSIEAVREQGDRVVVDVRYGDGGQRMCAQVISYPFVLAYIENTGKRVEFVEHGN